MNTLEDMIKTESVQLRSLLDLQEDKRQLLEETIEKQNISNREIQEYIFEKIKTMPAKIEENHESE